jgi:hypothetical protein
LNINYFHFCSKAKYKIAGTTFEVVMSFLEVADATVAAVVVNVVNEGKTKE